jgi:hypothetical protein
VGGHLQPQYDYFKLELDTDTYNTLSEKYGIDLLKIVPIRDMCIKSFEETSESLKFLFE